MIHNSYFVPGLYQLDSSDLPNMSKFLDLSDTWGLIDMVTDCESVITLSFDIQQCRRWTFDIVDI